jgi:hypothetical protein
MASPATKFHENLPCSSEVISGVHIDRQTVDLISLLSFVESRLIKMKEKLLGSTPLVLQSLPGRTTRK